MHSGLLAVQWATRPSSLHAPLSATLSLRPRTHSLPLIAHNRKTACGYQTNHASLEHLIPMLRLYKRLSRFSVKVNVLLVKQSTVVSPHRIQHVSVTFHDAFANLLQGSYCQSIAQR
jgi:hypothetical protein